MNVVHIIFLFFIVTSPLTWVFQLEHLYVYDARGFSIGTPIYLNVVHIIFFFPIVTPPLTWLFLLERLYTVSEDYIYKV